MKFLMALLATTVFSLPVLAVTENTSPQPPSLEDQVKSLNLANQAPAGVTTEKMYSIQERYSPLRHRSEVSVGIASNLTPDSFLQTQQAELEYRFHIDNRWSIGAAYAFVSNQFSNAGNQLMNNDGVVPDIAYARDREDLTVEFNAFYGKFRLSMDNVLYFDFYGALGAGREDLNTGTQNAVVADAGFAFWMGKWGSTRIGLKDYYYQEPHLTDTSSQHNLNAHVDVGYLF